MPGLFDNADLISCYTREQALADGELVAADPKLAAEAGFKVPVAYSRAVYADCIEWKRGGAQDETGRAWDVLYMAGLFARRAGGRSRFEFTVYRVPGTGRARRPTPVTLIADIGPGDTGEPVITIMFPQDA
jgi:hypothetical protein